jgi:hypothetical protein
MIGVNLGPMLHSILKLLSQENMAKIAGYREQRVFTPGE